MGSLEAYRELLDISSRLSDLLRDESEDSFSSARILDILKERQAVLDSVAARKSADDARTAEEALAVIRRIQALDQSNYAKLEKMRQKFADKLGDLKQSSDAYEAYYPVSGEAPAIFVDKKR
jgi:chorismate mutase